MRSFGAQGIPQDHLGNARHDLSIPLAVCSFPLLLALLSLSAAERVPPPRLRKRRAAPARAPFNLGKGQKAVACTKCGWMTIGSPEKAGQAFTSHRCKKWHVWRRKRHTRRPKAEPAAYTFHDTESGRWAADAAEAARLVDGATMVATYYWVGGAGTWNNSATTHWALTSGGTAGFGPPTVTDTAVLDSNSGAGTVTIGASATCAKLACDGSVVGSSGTYAGTLGGSTAMTIAGSLLLTAGMTYSYTGALTLSGTGSINAAGQSFGGNINVNAAGITVTLAAAFTSTATITLTSGTFATANFAVTASFFTSSGATARTATFGSSAITITGGVAGTWGCTNTTNLTVTANTAVITFTSSVGGLSALGGAANWNGLSFVYTGATTGGTNTFTFTGTIGSLSLTPTSAAVNNYLLGGSFTITGTFTMTGAASPDRLLVWSSAVGTQRTITCNGTVTASYVDLMDIKGAGSASWNLSAITGLSGDCQGNTGITFTTPAAQTWSGNTTGNWSTAANWTSRVPLPQDAVTISGLTSGTVTVDQPRLGANLTFAGSTGGTWAFASGISSFFLYGNFTLVAGLTANYAGVSDYYVMGRGAQTITTAGVNVPGDFVMVAPGGTYTQQDNLLCNQTIRLGAGTWTANNFNVSGPGVRLNTGVALAYTGFNTTCNMGTGTWTVTATGNIWATGAGMTLNASTSTVVYTDVSSAAKIFAGGGFIYGTLQSTAGGSGSLTITGSNTFAALTITTTTARTVTFTNGTTQTITGSLTMTGTASNQLTINSDSPGVAATISVSSSVVQNIANVLVSDSTGAGTGVPLLAFGTSTLVSNTTNWFLGQQINSTDTGSATEGQDSLGVTPIDTEMGSGAEGTTSIALVVVETGSGAEGTPSIALVVVETGSGAEGNSATVGLLGSDLGSGVDAAAGSAAISDNDPGAGVESQSLGAAVSSAESGSGIDAQNEIGLVVDADTGSGIDAAHNAGSINDVEVGAGADLESIAAAIEAMDLGSGVDDLSGEVDLDVSDGGHGTDSQSSNAAVGDQDLGSGNESEGMVGLIHDADAGSGLEGLANINLFGGDFGAGIEDQAVTTDVWGCLHSTDSAHSTLAAQDRPRSILTAADSPRTILISTAEGC